MLYRPVVQTKYMKWNTSTLKIYKNVSFKFKIGSELELKNDPLIFTFIENGLHVNHIYS
jgi:hypothetical protein